MREGYFGNMGGEDKATVIPLGLNLGDVVQISELHTMMGVVCQHLQNLSQQVNHITTHQVDEEKEAIRQLYVQADKIYEGLNKIVLEIVKEFL